MNDLTGCCFGKLTVLSLAPKSPAQTYYSKKWVCHCTCGKETVVFGQALKSGATISCGCVRRARAKENIKKAQASGPTYGNLKHGLCKTSEYRIWYDMRRRCSDSRRSEYKDYGGRGISFCERWRSFESFLADMGPKPSNLHTLDRKNNDGAYNPENCQWSTKKEQARNRRNNSLWTSNGTVRTLAHWAEILGVKHTTLSSRLHKAGSQEVIDAILKLP
jgi:hypothetical protein